MKKLEKVKDTIVESHEGLEDLAESGTSARGSSVNDGKKRRFSKLWVCTRRSNVSDPKVKNSSLKKSPNDVLDRLKAIENSRNESIVTTEKSSQTFFESDSTIDASTETCKRITVDVEISCHCESVSTASGPDTFVEIGCVKPSRSLAVQTDACTESRRFERAESKRDKWRCGSIQEEASPSWRSAELLEESVDIDDNLIYDGTKKCFPYPIELTVKPKYVATCESCESSTDKWVSISHGGLDAAVGSSIIIDVTRERACGTRDSLDESYQKSVDCEVCNYCQELGERTQSRGRDSVEETKLSHLRPFDECDFCSNHRRNRERKKRNSFFREKSSKSFDITNGDFTDLQSNAATDSYERWREKSSRRHKRNSSGERRFERSRNDNERHSKLDESTMFWNDDASSWLDDRKQRVYSRVPLHESTRLDSRSIENSGRTLRSLEHREIDPTTETKFLATSAVNKTPYALTEREINLRNEVFDEVAHRRRKPRTSDDLKSREGRKDAVTKRSQIVDMYEPFLGHKREEPFIFALQNFTKPTPDIKEFRPSLSGTFKISEFNNFGKRYDWDRPIDTINRRKSCKCGNGCGGLISRNKCCCRE